MPVDVPSKFNSPPVPSSQILMANSVISMENVKIKVLPSIINACLIIVILSAGNAFTFNATRSLHALALDGKAPRVLTSLSRHGVPYTCCIVVMFLTCLSYLAIAVIFQGRLELDPQVSSCPQANDANDLVLMR